MTVNDGLFVFCYCFLLLLLSGCGELNAGILILKGIL